MNDETDMSISEREAEQQYPTRYWDGHPGVKEFFNCTTDDLQDAYMRGREAEPCKEQVRAATVALRAHMHKWDIDHGFDRVDNGFSCSCGVSGYSYKGLLAHLARVCLNAAREAVSDGV